jgi:hypothetical protein
MKSVGYFFLMCGLLNSAAWGQSARPIQLSVVMRCAGLSCSAFSVVRSAPNVKLGAFKSSPNSGIHTAKHEVKLDTFRSFPAMHPVVRAANYEVKVGTFKSLATTFVHPTLGQVPRRENKEKTETFLQQSQAFPLSALVVQR